MIKQLLGKLKEATFSVLPIFVIVILLWFFIPFGFWTMFSFIIGALLLTIGMSLFTEGAEMSMINVGQNVGRYITEKKKLWLVLVIPFLIGMIVTIAEPDLMVLAGQVTISPVLLILFVSVGVGLFLTIAFLRVFLKIDLRIILVISYLLIFILVIFMPKELLGLAFDSGGVTTGPMTVPFIIAVGLGVATVNSSESSKDDSFGYVALCSIGPVLMVIILLLFKKTGVNTQASKEEITTFMLFLKNFTHTFKHVTKEILIALLPILLFSFVFMIFIFKESKKNITKVFIGILYTFIGVVLVLVGANIGFMPVGQKLGQFLGESSFLYVLIPLGMVMGFFVVMAEPAVQVLNHQVEEVTGGAISKKMMLFSLAIGVSISIGLSMARVIFDFSILYILIPGYLFSLSLAFFVPKMFTAIAFDSGGVASGPMTATFLLPLSTGVCFTLYENDAMKMVENSFGTIALVALTPLIVVQLLGLVYKIKLHIKFLRLEYPYEDVIDFDLDLNVEVMYE